MDLLIQGIANVLSIVLTIYQVLIFASVVISWIQADPYNPIVQFIRSATEPVYEKVKQLIRQMFGRPFDQLGGIDLTPFIILLLIYFIETAFVGNLFRLAGFLR